MQGAVSVENFSGLFALSAGLATAAAARPVMSSASPGRQEPLPVDIKKLWQNFKVPLETPLLITDISSF